MSPNGLVAKRMVWDAVQEEMLEEAHVLQAKKGYMMLRLASASVCPQDAVRSCSCIIYLVGNLGHCRVFAVQPGLGAMPTRRMRLLALLRDISMSGLAR